MAHVQPGWQGVALTVPAETGPTAAPWYLCPGHPRLADFTSVSSSILAPSAWRSANRVSKDALLDCLSARTRRHDEVGVPGTDSEITALLALLVNKHRPHTPAPPPDSSPLPLTFQEAQSKGLEIQEKKECMGLVQGLPGGCITASSVPTCPIEGCSQTRDVVTLCVFPLYFE